MKMNLSQQKEHHSIFKCKNITKSRGKVLKVTKVTTFSDTPLKKYKNFWK